MSAHQVPMETHSQRFPRRSPRTIEVTTGVGTGPTSLAAFDAALRHAGVGDFNLIPLSSVIPAGTTVIQPTKSRARVHGEWGDRLYVVRSESRADKRHQQAWAGMAWAQEPGSQRGLIVEHEGGSKQEVCSLLERTIGAITESRPQSFGPPRLVVEGLTCEDEPVCALVVAVFQADGWSEPIVELP